MAITDKFRENVANQNVRAIRIMMKNSFLIDPSFKEYHEMKKLAENVTGLYDVDDNMELNHDKSTWTNEYMDTIMVKVVSNFSEEKIKHIQGVVNHLIPETGLNKVNKKQNNRNDSSNPHEQDVSSSDFEKMLIGVIAGAVIGGGIAALIKSNVFLGATIGVVLGVSIVNTTKNAK